MSEHDTPTDLGTDLGADLDQWWRRLGSAVLVGTARRPAPSVTDLRLDDLPLRPPPQARPEEVALGSAAVGGALRRAGRVLAADDLEVPTAPPEQLAEAPARACQLLTLLLEAPPTDAAGTEDLLRHWCAAAREAGVRVPHRLLPALLDRASSTELRAAVSAVVGERGRWLADQASAWRWLEQSSALQSSLDLVEQTLGAPAVDPHRWAQQSTTARAAQLRRLRTADPAAARDLLGTTWARDSAKDRRTLLEALWVGLGPDDEELLEAALDDRAASVRELAAELLDGLPGSRRASRMAQRLRPLLGETGLLRRQLEVRLPDDPDAAGRRDGLTAPPRGVSARGWWLQRIVAGAPFGAWDAPAVRTVLRLRDEDAIAGLRRAAIARKDAEWARALLDRGPDPRQPTTPELLGILPAPEREGRVLAALPTTAPTALQPLLGVLPPAWSPRVSAAVVDRLAALKPEQVGPALEALVPRLVRGLHLDSAPALERWRARAQLLPHHDSRIRSLIQSRTLRATISEAFHP
ncbi:DUF5691 domain-containing protein [Nocardioides nanhaiensis]|uniref:DUF5691 domain-containing protein n=1 Tax=Nocardioides nanhaiensis TaxID=1476871 RepID=UPI0031E74157